MVPSCATGGLASRVATPYGRGAMKAIPAPSDDTLRGAALLVGSCVFFASMNAIIRYLSAELSSFEIVFFRNSVALVVMLPWLARFGFGALRTRRLGALAGRSVLGFLAMILWFWSLGTLKLDHAVALSFTAPLFTTVAAVVILKEPIRLRRVVALAVGFAGVVVILRPGAVPIEFASIAAILSSAFMALSIVLMKSLTATESAGTLVFYQALLITPISLVPALFVWQWPSLQAWFWLLLLGAFASVGHYLFTRAFAAAEATALMPFDYVRLPMVAALGYAAFGDLPDLWTWAGGAVILASTVYVAHREALARRALLAPARST